MTRIFFWNVERLGEGTDDDRKAGIKSVRTGLNSDYMLLCELTSQCTFPMPQPLSYSGVNAYTLCYGCLDNNGNDSNLTIYIPSFTNDYAQAGFKGGTNFKKLAPQRAVGYVANVGGVDVYVIHAPSSSTGGPGKKAMSFLACDLNATKKNKPWLVIGDFNVEPDDLATAPVGIQLSHLIAASREKTHIGKHGNDKELDYVLCNFPAKVSRLHISPRHYKSDHYPIFVEW